MKYLLIILLLSHFSQAEISQLPLLFANNHAATNRAETPQILPHPSNNNMTALNKELDSLVEYINYAPQEIYQAERSVWKIWIKGPDFVGTGFFISPNQFVTNFHNVVSVKSLKDIVLQQEKNVQELTIKKAQILSAAYDLAILEINGTVKNYLKLRSQRARSNEEIFSIGYPKEHLTMMKKLGKIAVTNDYDYSMYVNYSYLRGASGSPVLDEKGQVIGVLYATDRLGHTLSAIHINHLHHLLKEYKKSPSTNSTFNSMKADAIKDLKNQWDTDQIHILKNILSFNRLDFKYLNLDDDTISNIYQKFSDQKDPRLFLMLAYFYERQNNVSDFLKYIQKTANQNYAPAQHGIALLHLTISLPIYDEKKSFEWFKKAALQNYAPAQIMLYWMYSNGIGVDSDFVEAMHWLEKSALLKNPEAQVELAILYLSNPSYKGSYLENLAENLLKEAAWQGSLEARQILINLNVIKKAKKTGEEFTKKLEINPNKKKKKKKPHSKNR